MSGFPSLRRATATGALAPSEDCPAVGAWGHDPHVHAFHQLLYAPIGHAVVEAEGQPHHLSRTVALWIPAEVWHSARFDADCLVHGIAFDADRFAPPAQVPTSVSVCPRRRHMLLEHLRGGTDDGPSEELYDALAGGPGMLALPETKSRVTNAVAAALLATPSDQRTAHEWAESFFVSSTTLRRGFLAETGLTFSEWRTRARLNASVDLLASGHMVSSVAHRVGFTSTNGFILAFRRHFHQTPKAFATGRLIA